MASSSSSSSMDSILQFLLTDIDQQINFIIQETCEGCHKNKDFHECKAIGSFSRRRLCLAAAWPRVSQSLKDQVLYAMTKKALFQLDEGEFCFKSDDHFFFVKLQLFLLLTF